jgi:hypothetical protein
MFLCFLACLRSKATDLSKKGISLSRGSYKLFMAAAKRDTVAENKEVMLTMRTPEQKHRLTVMVTAGLCMLVPHSSVFLSLSFFTSIEDFLTSESPASLSPFIFALIVCSRIWYVTAVWWDHSVRRSVGILLLHA